MKNSPEVSVVIPAYNEATYIDRLLEALAKQNYKDFEVIVSDAESKDGTKEVVDSFKKKLDIKFIEAPPRGPAFGRNVGAKHARGEWLLFLDADVDIKDPDFIQKLLNGTKTKGWSTSSGELRLSEPTFIQRFSHSQGYMNLLAHTKHPIFQGYCMFTKHSVFEENRGFNEKIRYGEDNDYATRVARHGFGFVKGIYYYVDMRRYRQEGLKLMAKNILHEIYRLTHGFSFERNTAEYEFGKHKKRGN